MTVKKDNSIGIGFRQATSLSLKAAALLPDIKLRPHQQEVADIAKMGKTRLLLYHSLGSGKTLTSLGAAETSGAPYTAIVPASLRNNYRKEQEKFTDGATPGNVASYNALEQGIIPPTETLVFDEAQRLRNPTSETTRRAIELADQADNLYMLSGTPVVNHPSDLVPAIRMLTGEDYSGGKFDKKFVGERRVSPGLIGYLKGVAPATRPEMQNKKEFRELLKDKVHYFSTDDPGVEKRDEYHVSEMGPDQEKLYRGFWGRLPAITRWKLQNDYPLSKQEMMKMTSFMTGPRQVGLSTLPFMKDKADPLKAYRGSPKLQQAVGLMLEELNKSPEARGVAFSNFVDAGLTPYSAALTEAKIPHATFHGGLSDAQRKSVVNDYNDGKIRALLLGPSGGEGISLKGTRLLQILDPHWNQARTDQAVGRGIRYDSHTHLPIEDRNIRVQRFVSKLPSGRMQNFWRSIFGSRDPEAMRKQNPGADTYLENMAREKSQLNDQFLSELRSIGEETKTAGLKNTLLAAIKENRSAVTGGVIGGVTGGGIGALMSRGESARDRLISILQGGGVGSIVGAGIGSTKDRARNRNPFKAKPIDKPVSPEKPVDQPPVSAPQTAPAPAPAPTPVQTPKAGPVKTGPVGGPVDYRPEFKDKNFVVYTKDGYQALSPGKNYIGHYSPSQALDGYGDSLKPEIEKARAYAAANPDLKIQSKDYDDIFRPVPVYRGADVDSQNAGHLGITLRESTSGPRMTPRSAEVNNYPPRYDLNNEADDTFRHELRHSGQAAILDDDTRETYSINPSKLRESLGGAEVHGLSQAEQVGWAGGLQQEIFKLTGKRLESQAEARDFLDKATRATPEQLERAYPVQNREILRGVNWLKSLRQSGNPEEAEKALEYMSRIMPALVDNSSSEGQMGKVAHLSPPHPIDSMQKAAYYQDMNELSRPTGVQVKLARLFRKEGADPSASGPQVAGAVSAATSATQPKPPMPGGWVDKGYNWNPLTSNRGTKSLSHPDLLSTDKMQKANPLARVVSRAESAEIGKKWNQAYDASVKGTHLNAPGKVETRKDAPGTGKVSPILYGGMRWFNDPKSRGRSALIPGAGGYSAAPISDFTEMANRIRPDRFKTVMDTNTDLGAYARLRPTGRLIDYRSGGGTMALNVPRTQASGEVANHELEHTMQSYVTGRDNFTDEVSVFETPAVVAGAATDARAAVREDSAPGVSPEWRDQTLNARWTLPPNPETGAIRRGLTANTMARQYDKWGYGNNRQGQQVQPAQTMTELLSTPEGQNYLKLLNSEVPGSASFETSRFGKQEEQLAYPREARQSALDSEYRAGERERSGTQVRNSAGGQTSREMAEGDVDYYTKKLRDTEAGMKKEGADNDDWDDPEWDPKDKWRVDPAPARRADEDDRSYASPWEQELSRKLDPKNEDVWNESNDYGYTLVDDEINQLVKESKGRNYAEDFDHLVPLDHWRVVNRWMGRMRNRPDTEEMRRQSWKESVIELQNKRRAEAANAPKTAAFDAPRPTTIGRLMFDSIVPANYRGDAVGGDDELTANKIDSILEQVAHRDPGAYKEISHKLLRLGLKGSVETNTSFSLDDLESPVNKIEIIRKVRAEEDKINGNKTLNTDEKQQKLLDLYRSWGERLPDMVFNEAMKRESGLARMVASGARGSKGQLNSNIGADFAVSDSQGNQLPIPIEHSYSEGLTPAEYFAASYGTRLGLIAVKFSVQDGGYFCLAGETKVRTPDGGSVPISNIRVGDTVVGSTKEGKSVPVKVTKVFRNGVREASRYVFRNGRSRSEETSVVATEGHQVIARKTQMTKAGAAAEGVMVGRIGGWAKLPIGEARKGFAMRPAGEFEPFGAEPEPLAFLIGFTLGDGMMRGHKLTLSIGDQDGDVRDYLSSILEEEGFDLRRVNRAALSYEYSVVEMEPSRYFSRDSAGVFVKGVKNPIRRKFEAMGIWGKLAHEKTLPLELMATWDNKSLWGMIGGLIASDGCVSTNKLTPVPEITFAVTSEALCRGFFDILTKRLGVHCLPPTRVKITGRPVGRVAHHPDAGYVSNHDLWVVKVSHFDSIKRVAKNVELPGRKGRKLRGWLSTAPDKDPSGRGGFAFHFLRKETVGEIEVFDIEVDHPDHLYVLDNGMVVSNSKQLNAAAGDLIIVEEECKSTGGLPTDPMDKENIGSVLASDFGSVKAGTVITPKVMDQLKQGVKGDRTQIVVRSPITCTAKGGGICSQCAGVRENNRFLDIGENIGVNAASGLAEPVQQALLSTKHSAGVASAGGASQVRGFPQIDALAQIPDKYPSGASLAGLDGRVTSIDEAPQGGTYVTVGEKQHYVPAGLGVKVKKGQEVEAGDILSEGIPNPGEVTKYKGVGAGRVYFVSAFLAALKDNGTKADRRNTEVLSRALVNHVRVGDDFESNQFMPDEVVEYSAFAERYVPPQDTAQVKPDKSLGMYVQKPVLQYSVGTRITPSVIKQFHSAGVKDVSVSSTKPSFSPEMVRALDNPAYKDDFMTHTGQSYVKRNLMSDVQSGRAHSELHGKYFAPALAKGVEFGRPPAGIAGY